jgi:hypothetical protein
MSISTSQADHKGPLYRGLSGRGDAHHTLNRSLSTNISPGSLPTHLTQYSLRSVKSTPHIRSRSDQAERHWKTDVVSVAEQPFAALQKAAPAPVAFSTVSVTSLVHETSNVRRPLPLAHLDQGPSAVPKLAEAGITWNGAHSDGAWFAPSTRRNRQSLQQSSDSPTVFRSSRHSIGTPPKPLRPPPSRSDDTIGSDSHREVKLETSFTASILPHPEPQTQPRRRRFLNPRQIFFKTVILARRFSLCGKSSKPQNEALHLPLEHSGADLSPAHTLTHSTALRPNKTLSVLQRVTSILSETEAQISPHNAGVPKAILRQSILSAGNTLRQTTSAFEASGTLTGGTPAVSYTSSQRELRLGAAPAGTPEDNATYKVGDEVFFKVDISIRGGTSYLPSEARRIHTPPLPGNETCVQGPLGPGGQRFIKMKPHQETANGVNGTRPPQIQRALTRNWYDVQLQRLECEEKHAQSHGGPVDCDIPEHLPSSPLCPRNDRYWRYVQRRLKPGEERHRTCWMHGTRND